MSLNPLTPRCQGRLVRALGSATLARDCTNCQRRTDVPADVKRVLWITPPPKLWAWEECTGHIAPSDTEEVSL